MKILGIIAAAILMLLGIVFIVRCIMIAIDTVEEEEER